MQKNTQHEEPRLWARIIKKQRIDQNMILECDPQKPQEALTLICHRLDIARPLWLGKHQKEYDQFGRTAFTKEHFMETVPFTRLEIELVLPDDQKKKGPRDPRIEA